MPDNLPAGEHDLNALSAFVENRLTAAERARVEAHLVVCEKCRGTVAAVTRIQAELGGAAAAPASVSWVDRLTQRPGALLAMAATVAIATAVTVVIFRSATNPIAVPSSTTPPAAPSSPAAPPASGVNDTGAPPAPATPQESGRAPQHDLGGLRGAERRVGTKRFRLEAGEWVDTAYDPAAVLPVTDVDSQEARAALVRDQPALARYAALGPRVIVVFDGVVYRFDVR